MQITEEIKNGIYWMGCNDFRTELFERIFPIPEGVTYNSYFIDDEKTCVIDAMDKGCRDEFLEDVEYLLHGRKLDYFVLQHMERGRFFIVKRAAAPVAPALARERDVSTDHVDNVVAGEQLVQKAL